MNHLFIEIDFSDFTDGFSFLKALLDLDHTNVEDFWLDDDGEVRIVVKKGIEKE